MNASNGDDSGVNTNSSMLAENCIEKATLKAETRMEVETSSAMDVKVESPVKVELLLKEETSTKANDSLNDDMPVDSSHSGNPF